MGPIPPCGARRAGRISVPAAERGALEEMRGYALVTMMDDELSNEALDDLPGVNLATNGTYAAELFLDRDHLAALHQILGGRVYLAAAPRRGRFLVGGVGAGITGAAAAWRFSNAGARVAVLEAGRVGRGSTAAAST